MLLFKRELNQSRMLLAVVSGPFLAWLFTPSILAGLRSHFEWLPVDDSVGGTVGCLIGMLAINIIAIIANVGSRAETAAPGMLDKGGKDAA